MEWRLIETAPPETVILVYVPEFNKVTEAWYSKNTKLWPHDCEFSEEGEPCNVGLPTHWTPLPKPPQEGQ